jgi:hypothetical protein
MRRAFFLASWLGLSACAGPGNGAPEPARSPAVGQEAPGSGSTAVDRLKRLEVVPPATPPAPPTGEVPAELLERIRADAARRLQVEPGSLAVVRAESVTWNDGSLGCGRPGEVYTPAPEAGYWVVLEAGGVQLDYRARAKGYFFLCESVGRRSPPG